MAVDFVLVVALLRAVASLLYALVSGRRLPRDRLYVQTRGVNVALLRSQRDKHLRAFVDGSTLEDGSCGLACFYSDGHSLNYHGRFDTGSGPKADSNLAELAAVFWVLLFHPRGQHLTIFSDSAHALRVVQAASDGSCDEPQPRRRNRGSHAGASGTDAQRPSCPRLEAREAVVASLIWWLLRLRRAQTAFYKVPGHKGFTQNAVADALARQAAEHGPECEATLPGGVPITPSLARLLELLLRFLLAQSVNSPHPNPNPDADPDPSLLAQRPPRLQPWPWPWP